jgi:DNA repair protein SbcC/Rad50
LDDGASFELSRSIAGASISQQFTQSPILLSDLLERLAPSAATDDLHHSAAISLRQNWLRGTHFLSIEALSALIDTDSSTLERRKQIFADLLGIRQFLDASRELERYRDFIVPRSNDLKGQVEALEKRVDAISQLVANPRRLDGVLLDTLQQAQRALFGTFSTTELSDWEKTTQAIEQLVAERARQLEINTREENTLTNFELGWSNKRALDKALAEETSRQRSLIEEQRRLLSTAGEVGQLKSSLEQQQSSFAEEQREITDALDALSDIANKLLTVCRGHNDWINLPLRELLKIVPNDLLRPRTRREHSRIVSDAAKQAKMAGENRIQIAKLRDQIASTRKSLPSATQLSRHRQNISDAQRRLEQARQQLERIRDPVDRLRTVGAHFLSHPIHDSEAICPVCGHDWMEPKQVQSAMRKTLDSLPGIVQILAEEEAKTSQELVRLQTSYLRTVDLQNQLRQLHGDLEARTASLKIFEEMLQSIGLNARAADIGRALQQHSEVISLCQRLDDFQRQMDQRSRVLQVAQLNKSALLTSPVTALRPLIDRHLKKTIEGLKREEAAVGARLRTNGRNESKVRQQLGRNQVLLSQCNNSISNSRAQIRRLNDLWQSLASGKPISAGNVKEVRKRIRDNHAGLNEAADLIASARAIADFEYHSSELEKARADLTASRRKLERLRTRIRAADGAIAAILTHYHEQSRNQVRALGKAVNILFSRMHANRVIDFVDLGEDSDFLKWFAGTGAHRFEPQREFSQGQKQDLALAIFLARARGLGGTFFLDEPMLHLDDLNRVGLLDVLRAIAIQGHLTMNLVITTANRAFARHMIEKFGRLSAVRARDGEVPSRP